MSRLDSVIRRLQAQRDCLDWAVAQLSDRPGVVFELGLGNGRTYDHLKHRLPGRDIYVFDTQVAAHPDCLPDNNHLYLGDLRQTLSQAANDHAGRCVLVHCDIGSGVEADNFAITEFIRLALIPALAPGSLVISDQPLQVEGSEAVLLPATVAADRYFIRRFIGNS